MNFSVLATLETVAEEDDLGSAENEEDQQRQMFETENIEGDDTNSTNSNELCMESFEDHKFDLSNQKSKYEC